MDTRPDQLLDESTKRLVELGWNSASDEANFPVFNRPSNDNVATFCYQVVGHERGAELAFIAQVTNPKFSASFGMIAATKFNEISIQSKDFRKALAQPTVDDVVALAHEIEEWAQNVDSQKEIAILAAEIPTMTFDSIKYLAALSVLGDTDRLAECAKMSQRDASLFGKVGTTEIERALSLLAPV